MADKHGTGALPPSGNEWMMGLTAASITFVRDATAYAANCQDATLASMLRELVQFVKDRKIDVIQFVDIKEYVSVLREEKGGKLVFKKRDNAFDAYMRGHFRALS